MSIYQRPYMQNAGWQGGQGREWALKGILITLFAVYLIQNVLLQLLGQTWFENAFQLLPPLLLEGYVHSLVTYGLLHDLSNPLHLLFNGLILYLFGREVEARLGSRKFLETFLLGVFAGGLAFSLLQAMGLIEVRPVVGASAGVAAIITINLRMRWYDTLQLIFPPVALQARYLFYGIFGLDAFLFLFQELQGSTNVASSAHLGGFAWGWLYFSNLMHRPPLTSYLESARPRSGDAAAPWRRKPKVAAKTQRAGRFTLNMGNRNELKREVDRILDKINEEGFGALTEEEKRLLDRAKDVLR